MDQKRNVRLLSMTRNPRKTIYIAARLCYSNKSFDELEEEYNTKSSVKISEFLIGLYRSGHHSVFEHVNFVFGIENATRNMLAQISRHRFIQLSVRGQRYNKVNEGSFVMPDLSGLKQEENGLDAKDVKEGIDGLYWDIQNTYEELVREGISKDQARTILPGGTITNMVASCNLRELMHFCGLRMCRRASEEIRWFATEMKKAVYKELQDSTIDAMLCPKCEVYGICFEEDKFSCGHMPTINKILSEREELEMINNIKVNCTGCVKE